MPPITASSTPAPNMVAIMSRMNLLPDMAGTSFLWLYFFFLDEFPVKSEDLIILHLEYFGLP
jgi:hypothetical protein